MARAGVGGVVSDQPATPRRIRAEWLGSNSVRDVPRNQRLLEIVCERRAGRGHAHLLAVVTPRQYDPVKGVLVTSEGELPLTGAHVIGRGSEDSVVDYLPGLVVKCPCGLAHTISLEPLREIVAAMRAYTGQLPRELSQTFVADDIEPKRG